ncbi:MAG: hypothetical protein ABF320_02680 [Lentimonas sp.]
MAITLEANYQKRLGLPNYSSHAYSVTVKTEVSDLSKIEAASAHLYQQLQEAVDRDIQNPGFLPGAEGQHADVVQFEPNDTTRSPLDWKCSPKQRGLIEKLMVENRLSLDDVNTITRSRYNTKLPQLSKMQASELIDFMFDSYSPTNSRKRGQQ